MGTNLSGAGEAINDEAINLDAMRDKNLTEQASVDEILASNGKISTTTAGDKISTCTNTTQILKKANVAPNTNCTNEISAKESANLNQNCSGSNDVNLTGDVPIAISTKFSRTAPGEKCALACEQIVTSNALNSSGTDGALATTDATGTGNTPTTIDAIDANNAPNLDGSFAATSAIEESAAPNATRTDEANVTQILKKASAASCKNKPQAELKNELNHAIEQQVELQNKSNHAIKSQIGHRSELSHDELQAEHQGKLNRAEQQDKHQSNLEGCAEPRTEQQSELDCAKSQLKQQSKPCAAEPQDVLILLSLGAFDFPQQCFIRANASGTRYFIRRPLPTRENHAAHQKISEIFSQWQR